MTFHLIQNIPYIVIGDETSIDNDTKDNAGAQHTITLHCWSQYVGMKEVKLLEAYLVDKLHQTNITLPSAEVILIRREFDQVLIEEDGITRHGISRYRIIIYNREG